MFQMYTSRFRWAKTLGVLESGIEKPFRLVSSRFGAECPKSLFETRRGHVQVVKRWQWLRALARPECRSMKRTTQISELLCRGHTLWHDGRQHSFSFGRIW